MPKGDSDKKTVGYRSPPARTQFKPGKSGNPNGRPKKVTTFAEDVLNELNQPHRVNPSEVVTKQRAIVMALVAQATGGEARAVGMLMRLLPKDAAQDEKPEERVLSPGQQALLRELVIEEIESQKPIRSAENDETQEEDEAKD